MFNAALQNAIDGHGMVETNVPGIYHSLEFGVMTEGELTRLGLDFLEDHPDLLWGD